MYQHLFDLPIQHRTSDCVSRYVRDAVVTRGPVTEAQFSMVLQLVTEQVRKRFDLTLLGAMQATGPVLRTLINVPKAEPIGVRRVG